MSSGCVRKTALQCSNNGDVQKDGFLRMSKVDWLDNNPLRSETSSDKECQSSCLNSCSCIAYAFEQKLDPSSRNKYGTGCLIWNGSFSYLKQLSIEDKYGNDFYLKLPPQELVTIGKKYV